MIASCVSNGQDISKESRENFNVFGQTGRLKKHWEKRKEYSKSQNKYKTRRLRTFCSASFE